MTKCVGTLHRNVVLLSQLSSSRRSDATRSTADSVLLSFIFFSRVFLGLVKNPLHAEPVTTKVVQTANTNNVQSLDRPFRLKQPVVVNPFFLFRH